MSVEVRCDALCIALFVSHKGDCFYESSCKSCVGNRVDCHIHGYGKCRCWLVGTLSSRRPQADASATCVLSNPSGAGLLSSTDNRRF
jgi:hypothetical protein